MSCLPTTMTRAVEITWKKPTSTYKGQSKGIMLPSWTGTKKKSFHFHQKEPYPVRLTPIGATGCRGMCPQLMTLVSRWTALSSPLSSLMHFKTFLLCEEHVLHLVTYRTSNKILILSSHSFFPSNSCYISNFHPHYVTSSVHCMFLFLTPRSRLISFSRRIGINSRPPGKRK